MDDDRKHASSNVCRLTCLVTACLSLALNSHLRRHFERRIPQLRKTYFTQRSPKFASISYKTRYQSMVQRSFMSKSREIVEKLRLLTMSQRVRRDVR